MKRSLCILLPSAAFAAYTYYYSDILTSIQMNNWTQNGSVSATSGGLTATSTNGGSLISRVAVPDGTGQYEVKTTLTLTASGGTYVSYLDASSDAQSGPAASGTFYAVELQNPTISNGACSATLALYLRVNGSVTLLSSTTVSCPQPTVIRAVRSTSNQIYVWVNNYLYIYAVDGTLSSGQPGIGARGTPAGNAIARVDLGPLDRVAPNPFNTQYIGTSSFPNRVDIQWGSEIDDANGTGVAIYTIFKNGAWVGWLSPGTFAYSDTTLTPSTTYTYVVAASDYHGNNTYSPSITVVTPPAGAIDPRRVGVRPTGAYWGALGEQVDLRSGNLNLSVPLLRAQGRGGWGVGLNLTYNSQNWRQDPGGTWNLGRDVGYGYGWKLLAGSITPSWASYFTLDHYTFTDATGAEYRLDVNNNGVWTSRESIYLSFDSNTNILHFPDGSFWVMLCASYGGEQDAGTQYPITMQDTNGNQINIVYYAGIGAWYGDSSARIAWIEDVRATNQSGTYKTYNFTYNTDAIPHLTSITNLIGTAEGYGFVFSAAQTLYSPFSGATFGQTQMLQRATITGLSLSYSLTQDTTGALTRVTLPYGGYLGWQYANYSYNGSRTQPEVQTRYLSKDGTAASQQAYSFYRDSGDSGRTVHAYADLYDPGGTGEKAWFFNTDTSQFTIGLLSSREDRQLPGQVAKVRNNYSWTQDSAGNAYISAVLTTLDPATSYQKQKNVTQMLDTHGNLTALNIYDFSNLSSPARQYSYSYLTDGNYTSRYIYNRVLSASVSAPGQTSQRLVTNYYDNQAACPGFSSTLANVTGQREHDDANYGTGFVYRGNVIQSVRLEGTACAGYDILGNSPSQQDKLGRTASVTTSSSSNFAAPTAITMGSYSDTLDWKTFLGLHSDTKQNGDASVTEYDSYARPTQSNSPYGALTTYTYTTSPPTVTATIDGRSTKTTLDGVGRTIKVEASDSGGVKSRADTVYDSFGCSPLGKMKQQSMPYDPIRGTPVWTTYSYDGLGRTTSVHAPDGMSTANYAYQGNTVTPTDPAGNWKTFAMDAMGNITQVTEPNPAGGANLITTYSYTLLNQLTGVSMTRNGNTQTRTLTYNGAFLTQTVMPETGTVNYTYNANGTLAYKIDAKNQKTAYTYDSLARVTQIQRYPNAGGQPDPNQTVTLQYDSSPAGWTAANPNGRLVSVSYSAGSGARSFTEYYSYTPAGLVVAKRLQVGSSSQLNGSWTYDNEGRLTSVKYPDTQSGTGPTYNYSFDTLGRPNQLTDGIGNTLVNGISYGPAGELKGISYLGYTETRGYNSLLQLTRLTTSGSGGIDFQYNFSAAQNNGKITSQQDMISGEQVTYTYDALLRLVSAVTSDNPSVTQWGQSYAYDGFGSLTDVNVTKGTAPSMHIVTDSATNRVQGVSYDANGNDLSQGSYDVANHFTQAGRALYGYGPDGKRVWKAPDAIAADEEFYFWSPQGQRLGTYKSTAPGTAAFTTASTNVYFGGRLIQAQGATVLTDRLGSNVTAGRRYYPYGQEKSATANNVEKFTGYFRDAETGLDYADQRYHQPGMGRFTSPDRSLRSARLANPSSWNRYAYVTGDPVNFNDPRGLTTCDVNGDNCYDSVTVNGDTGQAVWSDVPNCCASDNFIDPQTWGDPPPRYQGAEFALAKQMSSQLEQGCPVGQTRMANGSCDVALNPAAQEMFYLMDQMNPGGFVNAFGLSMLGALAVGDQVLAATEASWIIAGSNNTIVLGRYEDGYVNIGGVVGAETFSIPKAVWDAMTADQRWTVNQSFLDAAITRNATIGFTSDPSVAPATSGLGREYQYLQDQGYTMVTGSDGSIKMIYWPQP